MASVYNTLTHLIQGLVLAALFYVISIQGQMNLFTSLNLIISFGFVIIIWHSFIIHNQYIVMRVSILDTLLPVVLAVCQVALAISVNQPVYIFNLLTLLIIIMIEIVLLNSYIKNKDPMALEIFKEHYKELGSQFAQDLFDEFRTFEKNTLKINLPTFIIILPILTIFNYFISFSLEIKAYISFIIVGILLILFAYKDLNHFFNDSKKLKKYGYKW